METYNFDFTFDELREIRISICSKMLKASEILDKIDNSSNDALSRKLFSYWYDKYQILKSSYYKLCEVKK